MSGNEKYVEISLFAPAVIFLSQTRGVLLLAAIPRVGSEAGELFFLRFENVLPSRPLPFYLSGEEKQVFNFSWRCLRLGGAVGVA